MSQHCAGLWFVHCLTARWDTVSIYWHILFPTFYIIAAIIGYRRIQAPVKLPRKLQTIVGILITGLLIVVMTGLICTSQRLLKVKDYAELCGFLLNLSVKLCASSAKLCVTNS